VTEAFLFASILLNIALAIDAFLTRRTARRFERFMQQKEHYRERVAQALVDRFRYLAKAHRQDHDKLEPMAKAVSRQGDAVRIMRGGFNGLSTAYGDAADDVQRFIVWELDATELLKEAEELDG
jgi:hypothetical protein